MPGSSSTLSTSGSSGKRSSAVVRSPADGSHKKQLTRNSHGEDDLTPAWSPDGGKIAFASNFQIYVMNADGSNQHRLTRQAADDFLPAWSPDGHRIAFVGERGASNFQIYVMNADGSNQHRLTRTGGENSFPAWSPDGRTIAFASERSQNSEIYIASANGGNQRRLTHQ